MAITAYIFIIYRRVGILHGAPSSEHKISFMVTVSLLPYRTHLEMGLVMIDRVRWAILVYKMWGLPDHSNYLINIPQVFTVEKKCKR